MIKRRKTKTVRVSSVNIGSRYPIVVQSMTNVATVDINRCVRQINRLVEAGCDLVRVAVPTRADTEAFAKIVKKVSVPLIADIHFSVPRAIEAIEAGAAKIRLNPGNIKDREGILKIIKAAKANKVAIRIGVNEASIRDLKKDVPAQKRVALMLREMKGYVRFFEKNNFTNLVLSAKSSDVIRTIEINRLLANSFEHPIHLGLTHAGLPEDAKIPSSVTLGALLADGIGDTIRVSVAGDPLVEAEIAKQILTTLGYRNNTNVEIIVCPTCARAQINVVNLARKIKKELSGIINQPLRVAVMGCIVNGPGEAADADIAVCAAKNKGFIYRKGKKISSVPEKAIIPVLLEQLQKL